MHLHMGRDLNGVQRDDKSFDQQILSDIESAVERWHHSSSCFHINTLRPVFHKFIRFHFSGCTRLTLMQCYVLCARGMTASLPPARKCCPMSRNVCPCLSDSIARHATRRPGLAWSVRQATPNPRPTDRHSYSHSLHSSVFTETDLRKSVEM